MLLLILTGCAQPETVHALVLQGWEYEWESLSHRISLLQVQVNQDSTASLGLIGGSFTTGSEGTDVPHYRLEYADIGIPGAAFAEAQGTWTIGPDASGTSTLTTAAPDGCGDQMAVYLNGFGIDTGVPQSADYPADYDPSLGYTSNGFAWALGGPRLSGGMLSVDVKATVRWAPQDRADMNAAIPFAQTGVSADVLFVCFQGDAQGAVVSGNVDYPWNPPFTQQDPMTTPFSIVGDAQAHGNKNGVVGGTGFDLQAMFTDVDGSSTGDYLRSYGVELTGSDDGKGTWSGSTTAQITNSSLIEYGDEAASFAADYTRIGVRGATTATATAEGTHDVGAATITLPSP